MRIISRILNRWDLPQFNIFRTLLINFSTLPFSQAIKLPIFIYGKVLFPTLDGKIHIKSPVKTKMIKIGYNKEHFCGFKGGGCIDLMKNGILEFNGFSDISTGVILRVNGILKFGDDSFVGAESKIICDKSITILNHTRITFQNVIMDTNFHSILNTHNNTIAPIQRDIKIGNNVWVGNRCNIMPGSQIGNGTIIAAKSLVNKDFTNLEENILIGGAPAKLITTNVKRIFNDKIDVLVNEFYINNVTQDKFFYTEDL